MTPARHSDDTPGRAQAGDHLALVLGQDFSLDLADPQVVGLAACQRGFSVVFTTAAALVHQLMEARDEKRLLRLQTQLDAAKLLIVDELGYVPLSQTGAELLFEVFSRRHERGSTIVTSNLPFDEWTSVFGNQCLTGALLERLTHRVHILEMSGESYLLRQSKTRRRKDPATSDEPFVDPETGEISPAQPPNNFRRRHAKGPDRAPSHVGDVVQMAGFYSAASAGNCSAVDKPTEIFVGIDVSKARIAFAVASG